MGRASGFCLRLTQLFVRCVQFGCAAIVLGIFSYFLATLVNHDLPIGIWVRVVEGISGVAIVYTILSFMIHCCCPGHPFPSFIQMCLDVLFIAGFIYIAIVNRGGASSCTGEVDTAFGKGNADTNEPVDSDSSGFTQLPSLRQACKMETAVLSVSVVAAFFFAFSPFLTIALVRHRRKEKRFGPSPANDYTSGYGTSATAPGQQKKGLFNIFGLGRKRAPTVDSTNPNALPAHATPDDVRTSYATEQTRVGSSGGFGGGGGYGNGGSVGGYGGLGDGSSKYDSPYGGENISMGRYPNGSGGYRYDNNGDMYR